jgi:hypothetical protein
VKCATCPVDSGPCKGEHARRLCELKDSDPRYVAHLPAAENLRPAPSEEDAATALVFACPSRRHGRPWGRSCSSVTCIDGPRHGEPAGLSACLDCVRDRQQRIAKLAGDVPPGDGWVAPLRAEDEGILREGRPWEGLNFVKPWQRRVTACLVHLDTPELLDLAVGMLRAQTLIPHIVVVDAGSRPHHVERVLAMEAEDLEVALLRPRGWRATSQPVATAMDVAFAMVQTELAYCTHVDVFPKTRRLVEDLASLCTSSVPLVGYQMSPRELWLDDSWRDIPSHTATMVRMDLVERLGLRWSMLAAFRRLGLHPQQPASGFPDTEVHIGLQLREAGVRRWDVGTEQPEGPVWACLGPEPNEPYETELLAHARSYTGKRLFRTNTEGDYLEIAGRLVREARERLDAWRAE